MMKLPVKILSPNSPEPTQARSILSFTVNPFNPGDFSKNHSVVPTNFLCKLLLDVYIRHDFFFLFPFDVYTSLLIKYLLDFGSSEKFILSIFGC